MRKSELFALILSIVSDITEISKEDIMSKCHKEDVVEARLLVIYFCRKEGLLPSRIAQLMGMSHRNVNRSLSAVNVLISNSGYLNNQLKFYCETIKLRLGTLRESMQS